MARERAIKEGTGPCPHCGEPVRFKRTSGGKLSFTCDADDCDSSGYAEPNGGMERKWLASITKRSTAPAKNELAAPADKPAARSAFDLAEL